MWSLPSALKEVEPGSARPIPRKSKPVLAPAAAAPALRHQSSPFRPSSSSAIPFSWEHRPGIPKTPGPLASSSAGRRLLPLPPPLRSAPTGGSLKRRPAVAHEDPFAAALAECAKGPPGPDIEELFGRRGSVAGRDRRAAWSVSDRLGLFGLHASCKATCAVADSTVYVPRPGLRASASYGHLDRRRPA